MKTMSMIGISPATRDWQKEAEEKKNRQAMVKRYRREQKRKREEEIRTGYYTIPETDVTP